jgi:hypothetical protein
MKSFLILIWKSLGHLVSFKEFEKKSKFHNFTGDILFSSSYCISQLDCVGRQSFQTATSGLQVSPTMPPDFKANRIEGVFHA